MRGRKCLNVHHLVGKIFMKYDKRNKNLFNFVSIGHSAPKHVMQKKNWLLNYVSIGFLWI